jgi:MFS family permease
MPIVGVLADRVRSKAVLIGLGHACMALGLVCFAVTPHLSVMTAAMVVAGFGMGLVETPANALMAEVVEAHEERRQRRLWQEQKQRELLAEPEFGTG